jgi:hypothetical protein
MEARTVHPERIDREIVIVASAERAGATLLRQGAERRAA